jgi:hypothetical protein
MIKFVDVRWLKPDSWRDLTKFQLLQDINVNGYIIERGFLSNGGDIPYGFRNHFNPVGKGFPAFIAHDKRSQEKEPRRAANKQFLIDLKDCGVNAGRAYVLYLAVEAYRILRRIK